MFYSIIRWFVGDIVPHLLNFGLYCFVTKHGLGTDLYIFLMFLYIIRDKDTKIQNDIKNGPLKEWIVPFFKAMFMDLSPQIVNFSLYSLMKMDRITTEFYIFTMSSFVMYYKTNWAQEDVQLDERRKV